MTNHGLDTEVQKLLQEGADAFLRRGEISGHNICSLTERLYRLPYFKHLLQSFHVI